MIGHMQKSKTLRTMIRNILAALCFIFTAFLLYAVLYETIITQELPTDKANVNEEISDKYSFLPKSVFAEESIPISVMTHEDDNSDEEQDNEKEYYDKGWKN